MKFEILGPNLEVVQVVETSANQVRIGKNASNDVCLADASVSRVHAVLEKSGNGYKLSDRMSTGGTFVNDQKIEPSKPAMITSGSILRFGNISVRVHLEDDAGISSIEEADEEESGATLAMAAPSLEELAAGVADMSPGITELSEGSSIEEDMGVAEQVQEAAPAPAAQPPVPKAPSVQSMPASPAPSMPAAPPAAPAPAPAPVAAAAAAPAAKSSFGGGFGSSTFGQSATGPTTIIKKKKRPASFERRFLSARGNSNNCVLEVAMIWRDNVLNIQQFKAENGKEISIGQSSNATFHVNAGSTAELAIAHCIGNSWEILFNNAFDGFVLVGDKKTEFKTASNAEFNVPKSAGHLQPGSLACQVNGDVRAKFIFGEVSILIHFVDAVPFAAPLFGKFSVSNYGALIASLIIHFSLFSIILFATDRVDALMIDRILTASRFATVVEEEIVEEEPEEEKPDEEEPEEEEPEEDADLQKDAPDTPFAANTASDTPSANSGSGMSKGEAAAAAQATGLLAQANAMNSMLAAGMDMQNLDNLDWSSFDASAQAASGGYGLGTTGAGGGGAGLGGFGGSGFGPGGAGGSGAIRAAGAGYNADLGKKGEAKPAVKMKNPEVTGSLDKRIIQKVVRQHSGELRNCYEKEVAKVKGLNGRIVAVWLISPQGAVTKALVKESTIKNKNVENCVINSIKFWRFPQPKGGGIVQIEYPFVFELSSN